ncbi:glycosyltransferase [uncultured Algibacter sp.]|uniref:glycosyltransferase n=1 Tax=uncultured Algibacter sp. TaxID=298659 RepID=UPI0026123357|nr:glycosyltransferase [uncultured Algibacter sp.]
MKLSIVIPLYNKEDYIVRCLDSLLAQDVSKNEFEIIIVDDGSTDSSFSIAKEYAEKYPNIQLFKQKNGGAGAARNKGLEVSKGDYIYFLDADDYIAKNVFKRILELSLGNKLEILGFNTKYVSDGSFTNSLTENIQDLTIEVMDGMTYISKKRFRNEAWWYIIKRSFLLDTGIKFTEGRYLQDSIFTGTLLLTTNRISKVNMDVHRFVQVENSATTNKKPAHVLKFINDLVYAIEKYGELIKSINSSNLNYDKVINVYKHKQHAFVFTLCIKAFNCSILKIKDLKTILNNFKKIDAYPISLKYGSMGGSKTSFIYNNFVVPMFNNKTLFFLVLRIKRLFSSN